ncbi:MAG: hypothetical protein OXH97_05465 [Chloroflexota bacterium]|nr:hypothetical protein [Chloroflexota bacterium]
MSEPASRTRDFNPLPWLYATMAAGFAGILVAIGIWTWVIITCHG